MERIYQTLLAAHFKKHHECIFLSGARQVGKTTIAQQLQSQFQLSHYINWDNFIDRQKILSGSLNFLNQKYLEKPLGSVNKKYIKRMAGKEGGPIQPASATP